MGKTFFTGWDLWQQMTFVLACGIVATVFVGVCKLYYEQRKIRNYTKVEKGKQAQISEPTPDMLESQREEKKNEIPFGIRAIESGIEIDGVWISRSNTPVGSSRSSMTGVQQLDVPQTTIQGSSRNSSRPPSSFDVAVNAERINTNDSRPSSPRARGPPTTECCTRCGHSGKNRNSSTLQALEGQQGPSASSSVRREPVIDKSGSSSSNNSGSSSRRTSDETDFMAMNEGRPYQPAYINPRHTSMVAPVAIIPRSNPRTDLDMLQSHRMSHVAETGQLTPRVRRPGHSGEWASVADSIRLPQEISTVNGVDYFAPQQKTPSPPPPPVAIPSFDAPVPSALRPTQDSNAANQARQAMPLLETYAARPFYLPESYQPRGPHNLHIERSYEEVPIEVNTSQNQQRGSQVLRKVNSGFEILRPGTLQLLSPEEEERAAMAEKRQSRRLQKKRRTSSAGSRTSAFTEQV